MKSSLRRNLSVIVIILVVIAATIYGFLPRAIDVDLAEVTRGELQVTIEEEGRTRLKERFVLSAPAAGYMRRIEAKVGDPVRKGQVVAVLEPLRSQPLDARSRAETEAAVSAAEAALGAAREKERAAAADADYLEKRAERIANLFAKGSVAKDQYEQTASEAKKARAALAAAKAAVEVSRSDLDRIRTTLQPVNPAGRSGKQDTIHLPSPIDGAIFRIHRESEGAVSVGTPLLDIGNAKDLEVRVELLSSDAVKVKKGMKVLWKRWGGDGALTGVVRVVEPAGFTKVSSLGVEEQRVLVIADITSPPETWAALGDGYRLEAHFVVWEAKAVLQVPAGALFRSGNGWAAFVEENGKARLRDLEVGHRNGLKAEIISGLKERERVIVYPDDSLRDGSPVRPR